MWSSTTAQTAKSNSAASDNKKKEDSEDCRCSSGAAVDAAATSVVGSVSSCVGQQQLNTFDNNSIKLDSSSSAFGGYHLKFSNEPTAEKDLKKNNLIDDAETVDSGFISGPQLSTTNIFSSEIDAKKSSGSIEEAAAAAEAGTSAIIQKFNIAPNADATITTTTTKQAGSKLQTEQEILDSGCIDDAYDEEIFSEEQQQQQPQKQKQQQQIAANEQMLLKHDVEAGMAEWICNLSLQTDAMPSSQQLQQQVAGIGMNNLNIGNNNAKKSTAIATSVIGGGSNSMINNNMNMNNRQQQQQIAGNSANTSTTAATTATPPTTTMITPSNAWEHFYQQNDDGDTQLHLACISGDIEVVAALIRMAPHPCLFNIQNDEAQTPLHLAALTAQPKILRMLLIVGAEPTIRDRHGNTALHLACISGEGQCVRALTIPISASEINHAHRQYGHRSIDKTLSQVNCARLPSDMEIRNYDGERYVHLAAQAGHIEILRILVTYGADINAREGKSGRTPLHIAIECCNEDLANFLLDECQKLNLETATYAGLTAYQVACILNKSQMQNILEKRGAEPLTPPDSDYDSSDIETDLDESKSYDRFGDPGYFASYNGGNTMTVA